LLFEEPDVHLLSSCPNRALSRSLLTLFYRPDRGDIVRLADGRRLGAWLPWHFDLVYVERINRGGVLRGIDLPDEGGMTGFIDGMEAYERLPRELKNELEGHFVVYRFDRDLAGLRFGDSSRTVTAHATNDDPRQLRLRQSG
jgi:taurine dioxygenase